MKFAANWDNQINRTRFNNQVLNGNYHNHPDFVLEEEPSKATEKELY